MDDHFMREYIMATEYLLQPKNDSFTVATEISEEITPDSPNKLLEDLHNVVFKLRAFTEMIEEGDTGLGIELGMQRAADMIEHIISNHCQKKD